MSSYPIMYPLLKVENMHLLQRGVSCKMQYFLKGRLQVHAPPATGRRQFILLAYLL